MSYFLVKKQPIFLSNKRYRDLVDEVSKGKDPRWITSSTIIGHLECREKLELMNQALLRKYEEDPKKFEANWLRFDMVGDDATQEVWDVLYSYCHLYGFTKLVDLRDSSSKIYEDFMGYSSIKPMGDMFALTHIISPVKWFWPIKRNTNGICVIIKTAEVLRIEGELSSFKLHTKSYTLLCGKILEVMPRSCRNAPYFI